MFSRRIRKSVLPLQLFILSCSHFFRYSGAAGKVFKIEASVGQAVKKGDAVLVLEIMKMETPVVAPQDGTVASINVNVGDMVEAGALLATLN